MTYRLTALPLLLVLTAVAATACGGSSTDVSSTWTAEGIELQPVGRTLVIGVAEVEANRVLFENQFAQELISRNVDAVTSHELLGDVELNQENVRAGIEGESFESVLITRVIREETRRIYTPPAGNVQHGSSAGMYDAMARSSYDSGVSGTYVEQEVAIIETAVFNVAADDLVWSAETESVDPGEVPELITQLVDALVDAMSSAGLL